MNEWIWMKLNIQRVKTSESSVSVPNHVCFPRSFGLICSTVSSPCNGLPYKTAPAPLFNVEVKQIISFCLLCLLCSLTWPLYILWDALDIVTAIFLDYVLRETLYCISDLFHLKTKIRRSRLVWLSLVRSTCLSTCAAWLCCTLIVLHGAGLRLMRVCFMR